jgi:protein disulfide-isomerase
MKLWSVIFLALLLLGCGRSETAPQRASAEDSAWLTDFAAARAQARAENKMLLINFTGSDWCPPCLMLHREILAQPEFGDYAGRHLVLLEVDFPRTKEQSEMQKAANEKLAERFGIYGFPTVIVLDANGKKVGELAYMRGGPEAFIAALEKLRTVK